MLHRTRETAEYFDENIYAVKQLKLLDEIVSAFPAYFR